MKKFMAISFALCAIASLKAVAYAPEKDKVPKSNECSLTDIAFIQTNDLAFEITAFHYDDAFIVTDAAFKDAGSTKVFKIGEGMGTHTEMIVPRFDPGEFASRDYKSPHVDRSWVWIYSHFHSC